MAARGRQSGSCRAFACALALLAGGASRARAQPKTEHTETEPRPAAQDAPQPEQEPSAQDGFLRWSGLLQIDGVFWHQAAVDELDPATGAPLNEDRFLIRRARVRLDVGYAYVRGYVQIDANTLNGPTIRLLAAELSLACPAAPARPTAQLNAGLFLIPFGFETRQQAAERMFLEPATWVSALFPGRRDLGARVAGEWLFLRADLALTNGNPSSSAQVPLRDPNRAKDVVGRLGAEGDLAAGFRASAGVSALFGRGFHAGAAPTKERITVRDVNEDGIVQSTEIQLIPGSPGEASANFAHSALGADLAFEFALPRLGHGRLYGEAVWAQDLDRGLFVADPIARGQKARELAWMAALRQALTRHAEVGLRYDVYQPDRDASDREGVAIVRYDARFSTMSAALAWCTLPRLRVTLQYDHRQNPLGRSQSGTPTTLASDSLTLRAQLML